MIQIKQLYGTVRDPYRTLMEFADEVTCKRIYSDLNFSWDDTFFIALRAPRISAHVTCFEYLM